MDLILGFGTSGASEGGVAEREEMVLCSSGVVLAVGSVSVWRGETMSFTDLIDGLLKTLGGGIAAGRTVGVLEETPSCAVDGARSGLGIAAPKGLAPTSSAGGVPASTAGRFCSLTERASSPVPEFSLTVDPGPASAMPAWISSTRIPSNRSRNTVLHRANPHWTHREPLNRGGIAFSHPGDSHMRAAGFDGRFRFLG